MGGRVWWSMARDPSSVWSIRFKLEVRPNYMEDDRSTVRTRLRIMNNRWFLDRTLQLKMLLISSAAFVSPLGLMNCVQVILPMSRRASSKEQSATIPVFL